MYLSRLVLDARSRDARAWLADCHAFHRVMMSGFPGLDSEAARAALGILYRVEPMTEPPSIPVLVQSKVEPRWLVQTDAISGIEAPKPLDGLLEHVRPGSRYRFRLRANPTRRVHGRATLEPDAASARQRAEKTGSKGKRVELTREEDQTTWLQRRAEVAGFSLIATRLIPHQDVLALQLASEGKMDGRRDGQRVTVATVLFEGILQVANADRFREALVGGVGPGKAFGCGLLSIAPVQGRAS